MILFLKGLHLTIDSWRSSRDADGWRQTSGNFEPKLDDGVAKGLAAPDFVQAVRRLENDFCALGELTDLAEPPHVPLVLYLVMRLAWALGSPFGSWGVRMLTYFLGLSGMR
jgi:hypothetical protein